MNKSRKENIPVKTKGYIKKNHADDVQLISISTGQSIKLNSSAYDMYMLCDGKKNEEQIILELLLQYDLEPEIARQELKNFLVQARKSGIIDGSYTIDVTLALTGRCNLKCKHCCAKETWESEDIKTEKLLKVIDELIEAGMSSANIFGGEAFMRENIFEIIKYLHDRDISILINTNGTLISKKSAKLLMDYGVDPCYVSLDGASAEIHDKQRGKGSFEKTLTGIKYLKQAGLKVILSFIVTNINQSQIELFAELGKKLEVDSLRYNHVFYSGNALCYMDDIYIKPSDNIEICKRIASLREKYGDFIIGTYTQEHDKLTQLGQIKPEIDKISIPKCGAGVTKCVIRPDGEVAPCEILWDVALGNLYEKSFADIWSNSPVLKDFRETKYLDLKDSPECVDCEYQFICFKGHRCYPYYFPNGIKDKKLYCYKY